MQMLVETRSVATAGTVSGSSGTATSGKRVLFATEGGVALSVSSHEGVTPESSAPNAAIAGFDSVSLFRTKEYQQPKFKGFVNNMESDASRLQRKNSKTQRSLRLYFLSWYYLPIAYTQFTARMAMATLVVFNAYAT
ncbi:hypothetical protein BC830DRAFT_1078730 [Chytriomyces sp. MP71]|nr:hypothetical protein BC830DRAFT_1078730 [Chytriomyces sp. MP71]